MQRSAAPQVILFLPPNIRTGFACSRRSHTYDIAFFEGQRPIRGYIYVPHHNLISRGPSRGRGTLDGVPTWPPDVRGTDVLPATDRRLAHPPKRVCPECPWADRDLSRNPVPTCDFGPERPVARALPRDLGRHAGGTRQSGRRPRLQAHLRPAKHRPPCVGRPPPHVHLLRLCVDLIGSTEGPDRRGELRRNAHLRVRRLNRIRRDDLVADS